MKCFVPRRLLPILAGSLALVALLAVSGCDRSSTPPTSEPLGPTRPDSAAPAASGISFGNPKPAVGDAYKTTLRTEIATTRTDADLPGIEQEFAMGFDVVAATVVLEVSVGRETKWKHTVESAAGGNRGEEDRLPIAGKVLIATRKGDSIVATSADGPAVPEQAALVTQLVEYFDSWDLPRRALVEGEEVTLKPDGDVSVTGTMRFLKREGDIGWFERVQKMNVDGVEMTTNCRAAIRVADGRVVSTMCELGAATGGASGSMRTTATRRRHGDPPPPIAKLDAAKLKSKATDAFDTVCYGEKDLTEKQRFFIHEELYEGTDHCPGWSAATITIGSDGLKLNGQEFVAKVALPKANELIELSPVARRLGLYRKRWKLLSPGKAFPGKATIEAPEGTHTAVVLSAALTAARSGFVNIRIEVGAEAVSYTHFVPGPPPIVPSPRVVYVEPLQAGGLLVGVPNRARKLDLKAVLAKTSDFEGWLVPRCADEPCFGAVVFRPLACPIEQTLSALRSVLSAQPLTKSPPKLSFIFGCGFPTEPPWGARTPKAPCF